MDLSWTAIDENTVPQWTDLTNLLAEADDTGETYDIEALAEELEEHGVDPAQDTWAVWDGERMVAYGQLRVIGIDRAGLVKAHLSGGVDPAWRGRGIGRDLMGRIERRALALAGERHPGIDISLRADGLGEGSSARALLEHRGYEIQRYFTSMRIDLPAEIAEPAHAVRPYDPAFSEALRDAHNDAFTTHWGSNEVSPEQWHERMTSSTFRPGASAVALADDGSVAAYTLSYQYVTGELYVGQVGTRQAERGRGLARATLLAALAGAMKQGYALADLDVDSENPTGAGALYESVGFRPVRTQAAYALTVPAGSLSTAG